MRVEPDPGFVVQAEMTKIIFLVVGHHAPSTGVNKSKRCMTGRGHIAGLQSQVGDMAVGGDVDDTLVIIFNLCDYTATGIVGEDDVVAQITSGTAVPPPDTGLFAAKEGERGAA